MKFLAPIFFCVLSTTAVADREPTKEIKIKNYINDYSSAVQGITVSNLNIVKSSITFSVDGTSKSNLITLMNMVQSKKELDGCTYSVSNESSNTEQQMYTSDVSITCY